jgi:hypothetical protein
MIKIFLDIKRFAVISKPSTVLQKAVLRTLMSNITFWSIEMIPSKSLNR